MLVATDVAARGLDINGVELVVQLEPPKDPEVGGSRGWGWGGVNRLSGMNITVELPRRKSELCMPATWPMWCAPALAHSASSYPTRPQTYIHRSGRTGRAGSTGISITLVDRKKEGLIPYIQVSAWPAALLTCSVLSQLEGCCRMSKLSAWLCVGCLLSSCAHRSLPLLPALQTKAGLKFERVGAPQPGDMAQVGSWLGAALCNPGHWPHGVHNSADCIPSSHTCVTAPQHRVQVAGERALESVTAVDASVLPFFRAAAQKLLEVCGLTAGGGRLDWHWHGSRCRGGHQSCF